MNYKILLVAVMMPLLSKADSASIYKCTKQGKPLVFSDKPCPSDMETKLIYTEIAQEIKRRALEERIFTIKRLIANNQADAAKDYALKNNLSEVYHKQLAVYLKQKIIAKEQVAKQDKQQPLTLPRATVMSQPQNLGLKNSK